MEKWCNDLWHCYMDILFQMILSIITSGLFGAIAGGLVTHFSSKRLAAHNKIIEARREIYTRVNENLSVFFKDTDQSNRPVRLNKVLEDYRAIQIWGSDMVVEKISALMKVMNLDSGFSQDAIDSAYKEFIIAMRKDLLGDSSLIVSKIDVYAKIN